MWYKLFPVGRKGRLASCWGCGCAPPCPEEKGIRVGSWATGGRGPKRGKAGSREERVGVETKWGKREGGQEGWRESKGEREGCGEESGEEGRGEGERKGGGLGEERGGRSELRGTSAGPSPRARRRHSAARGPAAAAAAAAPGGHAPAAPAPATAPGARGPRRGEPAAGLSARPAGRAAASAAAGGRRLLDHHRHQPVPRPRALRALRVRALLAADPGPLLPHAAGQAGAGAGAGLALAGGQRGARPAGGRALRRSDGHHDRADAESQLLQPQGLPDVLRLPRFPGGSGLRRSLPRPLPALGALRRLPPLPRRTGGGVRPPRRGAGHPSFQLPPPRSRAPRHPPFAPRSRRLPYPRAPIAVPAPKASPRPRAGTAARSPGTPWATSEGADTHSQMGRPEAKPRGSSSPSRPRARRGQAPRRSGRGSQSGICILAAPLPPPFRPALGRAPPCPGPPYSPEC